MSMLNRIKEQELKRSRNSNYSHNNGINRGKMNGFPKRQNSFEDYYDREEEEEEIRRRQQQQQQQSTKKNNIVKRKWSIQDIMNMCCLVTTVILLIIILIFAILVYAHITGFEDAMSSILRTFAGEMVKTKYKVISNNEILLSILDNVSLLWPPPSDIPGIAPPPPVLINGTILPYMLYMAPSYLTKEDKIQYILEQCAVILYGIQPKSCSNFINIRDSSSNDFMLVYCINLVIEDMECCSNLVYQCDQTIGGDNNLGICGWDFIWYPNSCIACGIGLQYSAIVLHSCSLSNMTTTINEGNLSSFSIYSTIIVNGKKKREIFSTSDVNNTLSSLCNISETDFYRRSGGECNSIENPWMGAGYSNHIIPISTIETTESPNNEAHIYINSPNPRDITTNFFISSSSEQQYSNMSLLMAAWLDFFMSDFYSNSISTSNDYLIPMPLDESNEIPESSTTPPLFINAATTTTTTKSDRSLWIDASQIYGSTNEETNRKRLFVDGKINITECSMNTNHDDNKWIGKTLLNYIWCLEHNHIADLLKQSNESQNMDDEQLFQTSRLILSAEIVKVHIQEWFTTMIGNESSITNNLIQLWNNITSNNGTLINRIVDRELILPLELQSITRWHILLNTNSNQSDLFNETRFDEMISYPNETLYYLWNNSIYKSGFFQYDTIWTDYIPTINDNNNNNKLLFTNDFKTIQNPIYDKKDLPLQDILSDRLLSLLSYNDLRNYMGMPPLQSFMDLNLNNITPDVAVKLAMLYRWNIDNVDLLLGVLGENSGINNNNGFGKETMLTMMQLFIQDALQMDRFYTTHFDVLHYTSFGMNRIQNNSFKFYQIIQELFTTLDNNNDNNNNINLFVTLTP